MDEDRVFPGTIHISGLSRATTKEALKKYFEKCGTVKEAKIIEDRETRIPMGSGSVTFTDPFVAMSVSKEIHNIEKRLVSIKVEEIDPNCDKKKIFVTGIALKIMTEDELKKAFDAYGNVVLAKKIRYDDDYGFVKFESEKSVNELLAKGTRINVEGAQLRIGRFIPLEERRSTYYGSPDAGFVSSPKPGSGPGR